MATAVMLTCGVCGAETETLHNRMCRSCAHRDKLVFAIVAGQNRLRSGALDELAATALVHRVDFLQRSLARHDAKVAAMQAPEVR